MRAEDDAIREAERDKPRVTTALDALAEILNGTQAPDVYEAPEGDGRTRG